jgi:ribosomal protein S18 acetylase RimI-like enzyme
MRALEFITELFEPGKQNWKWRRQSSDEAFASFLVSNREYQWHAFSSEANPAKWEIQFRLMRSPIDPDGLDLFGQTGTGNSAQVLSTAVDITRSFLQTYGLDKVEEITFNAKEDSRINLYVKMIRRLLPMWDLSSRKSLSHGMQFTLTDPRAYDKPENKITEIKRIDDFQYTGGKKALRVGIAKKDIQKLPGNNALVYSTETNRDENGIIIKLWDSTKQMPKPVKTGGESRYDFAWRLKDWARTQNDGVPGLLIGKLVLEDAKYFPMKGAVQVDTITVDEDYRKQGIAKSLYGVALSILKRPLLAGSMQTTGGQRNWMSLAAIPGVEVKGYIEIPQARFKNPNSAQDIDVIMGSLGGQYIGKSRSVYYFAFDVLPGSGELTPAVKTSLNRLYGFPDKFSTGMYATWSSTVAESGVKPGIAEAKRKKKKKSSRAKGGYFFPGYGYYGYYGDDSGSEGDGVEENFADGKKPGRKGLAKRVGVDCKQPISKLRSIASNSSGEKQRMAHWCANMKSGKKK